LVVIDSQVLAIFVDSCLKKLSKSKVKGLFLLIFGFFLSPVCPSPFFFSSETIDNQHLLIFI